MSKDAGGILASDQARAIHTHFLRDLTKPQLVEAFQEGFEANAKDKAGQKTAFDKMLALVPDVKEGGTLTFTYVPGKGTILQAGDKELGTFDGKGFADARTPRTTRRCSPPLGTRQRVPTSSRSGKILA